VLRIAGTAEPALAAGDPGDERHLMLGEHALGRALPLGGREIEDDGS
jgi:hypothetical protein